MAEKEGPPGTTGGGGGGGVIKITGEKNRLKWQYTL
jgi:hypothetical protein